MKAELLKLLQDHSVDYKDKGANVLKGCVAINCPVCKNDPSYHLNINLSMNYARCFICDYREKDPVEILRIAILPDEFLNMSESINILLKYPYEGGEYDAPEIATEKLSGVEIHFNDLWNSFKPLGFPYTTYLNKRGLNLDYCNWLGVQVGILYTIRQKQYSFLRRVIFPIREPENGQIVNFSGRTVMLNNTLRYKNCPNELSIIDADRCLFGLWECKGIPINYVVIVEGIIDCIKLLQNGIKSVALMKKVLTDGQMELLAEYFNKDTLIFMFLDPDALDKDWKEVVEKLSLHFQNIKTVHLHGLKDIGDAKQEDIELFWTMVESEF